ncbi:hypothetical protein [Streptomyces vinaceus]|uniref:hypothetical protein n=1 Tax=Streptomyces vinaceus TaxID=1960 RepID=UPI00368100C2
MRKHHERAYANTSAGPDRDRLAPVELHGRRALHAAGWLRFQVCRALNTPPAADRPADQARAQRIGLALAAASIGR